MFGFKFRLKVLPQDFTPDIVLLAWVASSSLLVSYGLLRLISLGTVQINHELIIILYFLNDIRSASL